MWQNDLSYCAQLTGINKQFAQGANIWLHGTFKCDFHLGQSKLILFGLFETFISLQLLFTLVYTHQLFSNTELIMLITFLSFSMVTNHERIAQVSGSSMNHFITIYLIYLFHIFMWQSTGKCTDIISKWNLHIENMHHEHISDFCETHDFKR